MCNLLEKPIIHIFSAKVTFAKFDKKFEINLTPSTVDSTMNLLLWTSIFACRRLLIAFLTLGREVLVLLITIGILVPLLTLETGVEDLLITLWIVVDIGMSPSTPVLLICRRYLLVPRFLDVTTVIISCTICVSSVCGTSSITSILGFVRGGKTETYSIVRLNKCWSIILLLGWVTLSSFDLFVTCGCYI